MVAFARKSVYQQENILIREINFDTPDSADSAPAAVAGAHTYNICDLPSGAIVTSIKPIVVTAFNSATSDLMVIGDSGVANRYLASVSIAAIGEKAGLTPGYEVVSGGKTVKATITTTGAVPTAGKVLVAVGFVFKNSGGCNYGLPAVV